MEFRFGAGLLAARERVQLDSDDDEDEDDEEDGEGGDVFKVYAEKELPNRRGGESQHTVPLGRKSSPQPEEVPANANDADPFSDPHSRSLSARAEMAPPSNRFIPSASAKRESLPSKEKKKIGLRRRAVEERTKRELMPLPPESKAKSKALSVEESLRVQREQVER